MTVMDDRCGVSHTSVGDHVLGILHHRRDVLLHAFQGDGTRRQPAVQFVKLLRRKRRVLQAPQGLLVDRKLHRIVEVRGGDSDEVWRGKGCREKKLDRAGVTWDGAGWPARA